MEQRRAGVVAAHLLEDDGLLRLLDRDELPRRVLGHVRQAEEVPPVPEADQAVVLRAVDVHLLELVDVADVDQAVDGVAGLVLPRQRAVLVQEVRRVLLALALRVRGIDEALELRRPIYRATSYHGHFGRENIGLPWERTDKAEAIRGDL